MKNIILIILTVAALSACKKNNKKDIRPEQADNRISTVKLLNSNGHMIRINKGYDDQKRLISEESFDEQTSLTLKELFYYKDGKLDYSTIQNNNRLIAKTNYVYTDGKLSKMQYLEYLQQETPALNFEKTFEYKDGLIYKIATVSPLGSISSYQVFTFIKQNIAEIKMYNPENALTHRFSFEYDDQHNPFHYITETNQSTEGYSVNNVLNTTITDYALNQTTRHEYQYEYNDNGFPTKKSLINSGSASIFQASYQYSLAR